jgi:hypothetical protein
MKAEYSKWISDYVARFNHPAATLGQCEKAVEEMKGVFPELEVKKGYAICPEPWGKRGHWWLLDEEGKIIDPTRSQFTCGVFGYEEYVEGDDVRVGKCMNCGDEIWGQPERDGACICSPKCEKEFTEYLKGERHGEERYDDYD